MHRDGFGRLRTGCVVLFRLGGDLRAFGAVPHGCRRFGSFLLQVTFPGPNQVGMILEFTGHLSDRLAAFKRIQGDL